jgi:thermitase
LDVIDSIDFVEPNYIVKTPPFENNLIFETSLSVKSSEVTSSVFPDDPLWATDPVTGVGQWNMRVISVDDAWNVQMGDRDVRVAVLDTGVFWEHLDLQSSYMPGGYDWVNNDYDPRDDSGHGSWVAGIIAAQTNNSYGVAGIAQVSIISEKVLSGSGSGSISNVVSGILHASDLGVDIISMSLGTSAYSNAMKDAVDYAVEKGCLLVAAAGNNNRSIPHYPANFDNVVAVAATFGEPDDVKAPYSNYGSWVNLSAPGGGEEIPNRVPTFGEHWVISTSNVQGAFVSSYGTSAATPHVSGLAALYKSQYPNATNREIVEALKTGADDKGEPGWDEYYGHGRINAYRTLMVPLVKSVGGEGKNLIPNKNHAIPPVIIQTGLAIFLNFLIYTRFKTKKERK